MFVASSENQKALNCLLPGEAAVIKAVYGPVVNVRRIMALGFNPGARVKMIRKAPLGDPLEFEVCGCLLSLRAAEAQGIILEELA